MPGGDQLAAELGVGRNTVETALQQLESEGLLLAQGHRRRRKIQPPAGEPAAEAVHVVLLLHSSADRQVHYIVELFHELIEAGHTVSIARKTLLDLHMEVPRVASFANKVKADAWVVCAASREVLQWFASQPVPAFALFGRRAGLPSPALAQTSPRP